MQRNAVARPILLPSAPKIWVTGAWLPRIGLPPPPHGFTTFPVPPMVPLGVNCVSWLEPAKAVNCEPPTAPSASELVLKQVEVNRATGVPSIFSRPASVIPRQSGRLNVVAPSPLPFVKIVTAPVVDAVALADIVQVAGVHEPIVVPVGTNVPSIGGPAGIASCR